METNKKPQIKILEEIESEIQREEEKMMKIKGMGKTGERENLLNVKGSSGV